jgi:hypothetical protein
MPQMFGATVAVQASGQVQPLNDTVRPHGSEIGHERLPAGQAGADLPVHPVTVGDVHLLQEGSARDRARA